MCPMSRRSILLLIFLLALVLRLVVVLAATDLSIGLDDMFQYDQLARSIVSGNGYRWYAQEDLSRIRRALGNVEMPPDYDPRGILTSFRPPLYPALLALIYGVMGSGPNRLLVARLAQAVLGAGLAPLTCLLGRRMGLTERTAHVGAAIVAGYPLLLAYPLALVTENLYLPLLGLSLIALLRAGEKGRLGDYGLAGLVLGLTALTRSVVSLFVPVAAVWEWFSTRSRRASLWNGVVMVLCFLIVTVPWSVRNTLLHGEFHFVESALGYDLYMGYHPGGSGTFNSAFSTELITTLDDGEMCRRGMEGFWSFLRADPGRVPSLMLHKFAYFWGLDRRAFLYFYTNNFLGHWPPVLLAGAMLVLCGPFMFVAPSGVVGLALARGRRELNLIRALLVYYVGIHMLILAEPRFHVPLIPLLALLAAYTVVDRPWRRAHRWQKVLAVALILVLMSVWGWEISQDWDLLTRVFGPQGHTIYLSY